MKSSRSTAFSWQSRARRRRHEQRGRDRVRPRVGLADQRVEREPLHPQVVLGGDLLRQHEVEAGLRLAGVGDSAPGGGTIVTLTLYPVIYMSAGGSVTFAAAPSATGEGVEGLYLAERPRAPAQRPQRTAPASDRRRRRARAG